MCEIRAYETEKRTNYDSVISGGENPITDTSTTDALKYICVIIEFINSWLKSLEVYYY